MLICLICNTPFEPTGSRSKYCSKKCRLAANSTTYTCELCGILVCMPTWHFKRKSTSLCLVCYHKQLSDAKNKLTGSAHPKWRGGAKNWVLGRFGRDLNDLSWSVQRDLARSRDNDTCQHCGFTKTNLSVHHISPYRVSRSHALENLITLCSPCHHKADKEIREHGRRVELNKKQHPPCQDCGSTGSKKLRKGKYCEVCYIKSHRGEPTAHDPRVHCSVCDTYIREDQGGVCRYCRRAQRLAEVQSLLEQGLNQREISRQLSLSPSEVNRLAKAEGPSSAALERVTTAKKVHELLCSGRTLPSICTELGISRAHAYRHRILGISQFGPIPR